MRYRILAALLALLTATSFASAQPWEQPPGRYYPPPSARGDDSAVIARYWIRSYLRHRAEPDEARYWTDQFRRSRSPADVLSALLAGRDYADYAGGTREGFIAQLIRDVGHHEPSGYEVRDSLRRTAGMSRRDIASDFLRDYPANWWPGPEATPPRDLYDNDYPPRGRDRYDDDYVPRSRDRYDYDYPRAGGAERCDVSKETSTQGAAQ